LELVGDGKNSLEDGFECPDQIESSAPFEPSQPIVFDPSQQVLCTIPLQDYVTKAEFDREFKIYLTLTTSI